MEEFYRTHVLPRRQMAQSDSRSSEMNVERPTKLSRASQEQPTRKNENLAPSIRR
jgi:hypothetical protein